MIVSASHRTDIPAFYGDWFRARRAAGFAKVASPFGGPAYTVPLTPDAVDGYVFWTRNIGPFVPVLHELRAEGTPFVIQHTVTGYPRALDRYVPDADRILPILRRIAEQFGPEVVVWRYDPVVVTDFTPAAFHHTNLARIGEGLRGVSSEVVLSAVHPYRKTVNNMVRVGGTWRHFEDGEKSLLISGLADIAGSLGFRPTVCAQPSLVAGTAAAARCVDARRLERVAAGWGLARTIAAPVRGNRPGCECHASRDIGAYETCPHGCAYCYAVGNPERAAAYYRAHDPAAESLAPARRITK